MKDLVKIIEQESYEYKDPITGRLLDICVQDLVIECRGASHIILRSSHKERVFNESKGISEANAGHT